MDSYWQRSYFFDQGIHFTCQQCGSCCCGAPGIIRVDRDNVIRIAKFIGVSLSSMLRDCVDPFEAQYTIRERKNGCCLFYKSGCQIYPVRPVQCSTYPFWFRNLRSTKQWEQTIKACPGIGKGRHYTKEQILGYLDILM